MASVVGTYARAFADVVLGDAVKTGRANLDPARALEDLHSFEGLLRKTISCGGAWKIHPSPERASGP